MLGAVLLAFAMSMPSSAMAFDVQFSSEIGPGGTYGVIHVVFVQGGIGNVYHIECGTTGSDCLHPSGGAGSCSQDVTITNTQQTTAHAYFTCNGSCSSGCGLAAVEVTGPGLTPRYHGVDWQCVDGRVAACEPVSAPATSPTATMFELLLLMGVGLGALFTVRRVMRSPDPGSERPPFSG